MRIIQTAIIVAATASLFSCSTYREYSRPDIQGMEGIFGLQGADSASLSDMIWNEFFNDPVLRTHIEAGLKANKDLNVAVEKIKEAEATLKMTSLSFLPSLSFGPTLSMARSETRYDGSAFGLSLSPSASWEIDLRGNLLNEKRKARAALEQSEVYRQSVQTELIASIARAYYSLQMLDSKLEISQQTSDSWKENVRIMKAMKEAGMANEASVSQTEANSCSIEASLFDLRYQIKVTENTLCLLTGEPPHTVERSKFDKKALPYSIQTGIPAEMLGRRPDVHSAELELQKAFYNTNIAKSALYPSLKITGAFGWEKALTGAAGWLASLGAAGAENIFNAGRNRQNIKIAEARQREALLQFEKAMLTAGKEVNDAIAKCQAAQGKTDLRIQQIKDLKSAVKSTNELMHNSGATYLEVLTAQQSLLSAQLLQVSDQYDAIEGMISLYKALGGGIN